MENFVEFLSNNYLWFLIGTLILVFALIGYISETKKKSKTNNIETTNDSVNDSAKVDVPKGLNDKKGISNELDIQSLKINSNVGLNNAVNDTLTIKESPEEKVEMPIIKEQPKVEILNLESQKEEKEDPIVLSANESNGPLIKESPVSQNNAFIIEDKK